METKQVSPKKSTHELVEQFSKQKAEDPLIKYWIERKRGLPTAPLANESKRNAKSR